MIYVTGDTHGDIKRFSDPRLKRIKRGDTLLICGDFGFIWEGGKEEDKALKKLMKKKYNICFVDGTHEDFERLNAYPVVEWNGGKVHHIGGNIYHLMRGEIFTIEEKTVFAMGGGESPDFELRIENQSWSPLETPSAEELLAGAKNLEQYSCHVDYVLTHEPPTKIKGFLKLKDKEIVRVTGLNSYFGKLSESCTYERWFFGSMHLDKYISSSSISLYQNIIHAETGEPVT